MRVLVIDDHPSARAGLVAALSGFDVSEAASVDDAMAALAVHRPEAVVLDLGMDRPSASLHALLLRLRLPVVVVSGLEEEAAREAADASGWRCLPKPVQGETLRAVVEELAGERKSAEELARVTRPGPPPPSPTERPPVPERTDSGAPAAAVDPWRDRVRVVMDRVLYLAGLAALVYLSKLGKLDVGTTAAVMLVVGVRPHNLFEAAQAATTARTAGAARGAGLAIFFAPMIEAARSGTWLGR